MSKEEEVYKEFERRLQAGESVDTIWPDIKEDVMRLDRTIFLHLLGYSTKYYEEYVHKLLSLASPDAIRRTLQDAWWLESEKLYRALETLEQTFVEEGKVAQRNLLLFVRTVVDGLFQPGEVANRLIKPFSTAQELLQHAWQASNLLQAYLLLRKHQHLLSPQDYDRLEPQVLAQGYNEVAGWGLRMLIIIGRLLRDPTRIARASFLIAAYYQETGQYRSAMRRFTRAAHAAEELKSPSLLRMVMVGQATLYEQRGEMERAVASYLEALTTAGDSPQDEFATLPIRLGLANCYHVLGRETDALTLTDHVLQITHQWQLAEDEIKCRNLRGLALENLDRYEDAEAEYTQAAALAELHGDYRHQCEAMTNRAASFLKRSDMREAVKQFRAVLRLTEERGNPPAIAAAHNNLGNALLDMKRPSEAQVEFGAALRNAANRNLHSEGLAFIGMGDAHQALGDYETARFFYTLTLLPALESGDTTLLGLYASRLVDKTFEPTEKESGQLEDALALARKSGDRSLELILAGTLANYYLDYGKEQQALALYRETLGRSNIHEKHASLVIRLQVALARCLAKRPESRQEAYQLLMEALANVEERLQTISLHQYRAELIARWIDVYGALIDLLLTSDHPLSLPGALEARELAFNLHEAAKSRAFVALLADAPIAAPPALPPSLQERETQLLTLKRSLQNPGVLEEGKAEAHRLQRLREIDGELQLCWEAMKPFALEYVRLHSGEPATLQEIKALLSQQWPPMAFVSFFCDENSTTCFVLRSDDGSLRVYRSKVGRQTLNQAVRRLHRAFNGAPNEFPPYPPLRREQPGKRKLDFLEELSGALLSFLPAIQGIEHVCIMPHGPLHLLPLQMLRASDGRFLLEHCAVTYCPSLSTVRYCLARSTERASQSNIPTTYVAGVASRTDAHPEFFERDDQLLASLPWSITSEAGITASRSRVLAKLSHYDLIHLTCHGYFDEQDALNSGLLLASGGQRPPRETHRLSVLKRTQYLLTARDLLKTPMHARLVALRACSTGIQAERNTGDEFDGIGRALLYAGNASVVVSLWNVDQQSSQQLLTRFYRYWAGSEASREKWHALWMAQKEFLQEPKEPYLNHPYHWAPFVLIGDWR